jgi:hypothetical protein
MAAVLQHMWTYGESFIDFRMDTVLDIWTYEMAQRGKLGTEFSVLIGREKEGVGMEEIFDKLWEKKIVFEGGFN